MKKVKLFEQFIVEGKDVFPNEIVGNDQILFKKEWEKMNGGKLAAKYNQYYKGYDIDAGGRIFNSVDQLEKYIKATELSNNQYNKYKNMPEKQIGESVVNEEFDVSKLKAKDTIELTNTRTGDVGKYTVKRIFGGSSDIKEIEVLTRNKQLLTLYYSKERGLQNFKGDVYEYMSESKLEESNGIDSDIKKLETLIRKQFNVVEFKAPSKRALSNEEFLMVKVKDDKYGGPQTGLGKFIKRWTGVEASFVDNYGNDKVYWVSLEKIENGPGVHETMVNEEEAYSVTKNTFRDYDSLNITSQDSIQFKEDGKKWIVRCVTAHDNIDKGALQKLGFGNSSSTRYAGISTFTKNANWHDLELTKKEFDQLVKIVDAGWASHAKAFADFYKDRQAD